MQARLWSVVGIAILLADRAFAQPAPPMVIELPPVEVIGASPLLGSGVDRDTVPAATSVLKGDDLTRGVQARQMPFGH